MGKPIIVFVQEGVDLTQDCVVAENKGPAGENLILCQCRLRPLQKQSACAMTVQSESKVKFAYLLQQWSQAKN